MLIRSEKSTIKKRSWSWLFVVRKVPIVRQRRRSSSSYATILESRKMKPIFLLTLTLCLCFALQSEAQRAQSKLPSTSQQQQQHQPQRVSRAINNSEIGGAEEDRRARGLELRRSQRRPARANDDNDDAIADDAQQGSVLPSLPERTHLNRRNVEAPNSRAANSMVDKSTAATPEESGENGGGSGEPGDADYESSANGDDANGASSTGASGVDYAADATDSSSDAEEQPASTKAATSLAANLRPSRQSDSSPTSPAPISSNSRVAGASQQAPPTARAATLSPRVNDINTLPTTNVIQTTMRPANRASQQQSAAAAAGERLLQPTTASATTSRGNSNFAGRAPPPLLQQQLQILRNPTDGGIQQRADTTAPPQPTTTTFDVSMGADRLLLKSHSMATPPPLAPPTASSSDLQETSMATESVLHELLVGGQHVDAAASNRHAGGSDPALIHDRRQDLLLYPSNHLNGEDSMTTALQSDPAGQPQVVGQGHNSEQQQQQEQAAIASQMSSVCHTPFALFAIIILTMLTTMFVCFCTHALFKHLGRRQFDLIASSKQYNNSTNYGSGYLEGSTAAAALEGRANYCSPHQQTPGGDHSAGKNDQQQVDLTDLGKSSCMLSIFGQQQHQQGGLARDEHGCAFENPYFNDESSSVAANDDGNRQQQQHRSYQQRRQQQQEQQFQLASQAANGGPSSTSLLTTANQFGSPQSAAATILREPPNTEQLHFIEHHISNLHNRQVTSSVKELSILGSFESNGAESQVVDLTATNRQPASPADLVAVDITGHDFIGLGFDVCGNERDGIFIESVLSRGPAKESGCIEQGDRIKSLNISFDNITLQDAYDLLNCGSPYKMRLLLEKRALNNGLSDKMSKQKHQHQPIYRQQLLVNRLSAPPSSSMLLKHNQNSLYQQSSPRSVMSQQQLSSSGAILDSPLSVTKGYIRRLTNLVSLTGNNSNKVETNHQVGNENQTLDQQPPVYLLGSAAARTRYHSTASSSGPFVQSRAGLAHANAGYKTDDEDDDQIASETATATAGHIGAHQHGHRRKHSHAADSLSSSRTDELRSSGKRQPNGAGRASSIDSSSEIFRPKTSLNESGPDSSLDYQNQNANHRLHGPQLNGSRPDKNKSLEGIRDVVELNLNRRQSALAETTSGRTPAASGISLASAFEGKQATTLHISSNRLMMNNNLDQTQSQPEIRVALRDEQQGFEHQSRHQQQGYTNPKLLTNSELAAVAPKKDDRNGGNNNNNNTRNQKLMNSRLSSLSTPTINVGSTIQVGSGSQHSQNHSPSSASQTDASLVAGPLRISSKKPLMKRESIKEETHFVESDGDYSSSSKKPSSQKLADEDYSAKTSMTTKTPDQSTGTSNNYLQILKQPNRGTD